MSCRVNGPVTALPLIPEFTLLSRIGGGSYGEVFLARSVTGSYRAVKIVRREDFERDRTFEREFEGIQKFEKVSQDHPGLIDVLHAGRNDAEGFYYYVMELADDEASGRAFDPEHYSPRTLAGDLRIGRGLSVRECAQLGSALAEALGHLHEAGLTHRDVKPSNIIFVRGEPKLADIGLVADSGQRTYVGTEGYVPPEGPGTPSADLYGLAMVLYEMLTGKDRLEFPELPTNMQLSPTVNRDEWRALNAAVCRAGSPDPRKRFASGREMSEALRRALGEKVPRRDRGRRSGALFLGAALALLGVGGYTTYGEWQKRGESQAEVTSLSLTPGPASLVQPGESPSKEPALLPEPESEPVVEPEPEPVPEPPKPKETLMVEAVQALGPAPAKEAAEPLTPTPPPAPQIAWLKIATEPREASVFHNGVEIARTPTGFLEFVAGKVTLEVRLEGYHTKRIEEDLEAEPESNYLQVELQPDNHPVEGESWKNHSGLEFLFNDVLNTHITEFAVSAEAFRQFVRSSGLTAQVVEKEGVALIDDAAMWAFCDWHTKKDREEGFLDEGHYLKPQRSITPGLGTSFHCLLDDGFGSLAVNSEPAGAEVRSVLNGEILGQTPLVLDHHREGPAWFSLRLPGYREQAVTATVLAGEVSPQIVKLERDASLVFGEPWTNSLGMKFVRVGAFMSSIWETRESDYAAFAIATGAPELAQEAGADHPAGGVNVDEARAFCAWLTERERAAGFLSSTQSYHVPTDLEWSEMVGLTGETGSTPQSREWLSARNRTEVFPWDGAWPPPARAGNFADKSASARLKDIIPGYDDGAEKTAPVGSYEPNALGIYDLSGNVWEWVDDLYNSGGTYQAVRGGAWNVSAKANLLSYYRNAVKPQIHDGIYGFRCVIRDAKAP